MNHAEITARLRETDATRLADLWQTADRTRQRSVGDEAALNTSSGRELGLLRGANVIMPNLTPGRYRVLYEIYPGKARISETADACHRCIRARIRRLGRRPGTGRGDSPNYAARRAVAHLHPAYCY